MRHQTNTVPTHRSATGSVAFPLWNRSLWWQGAWQIGGFVSKWERPAKGAVIQR